VIMHRLMARQRKNNSGFRYRRGVLLPNYQGRGKLSYGSGNARRAVMMRKVGKRSSKGEKKTSEPRAWSVREIVRRRKTLTVTSLNKGKGNEGFGTKVQRRHFPGACVEKKSEGKGVVQNRKGCRLRKRVKVGRGRKKRD